METLKEIGVEIKFWKVNIKPGMPLLFGMYGTTPVFGLPGNPVSTMVTFLQFVKPALMKMMGYDTTHAQLTLYATIEQEIKKSDGKRHYMRGRVEEKNGSLVVRSTGPQISNILSSLARANCLIIIPEDKELVRTGEKVEIELL
jgi:molybdopterin molybdotransferase